MAVEKKPKFRHELKYLINEGDRALLCRRLDVVLHRDRHAGPDGKYKIRSLYFDDYWNTAYEEKLMGVSDRKKYRIRFYNDRDDVIHLECKRKSGSGSYIHKTSASLTREETDKILTGDYGFLLKHENPLCRQFYVQCVSRVMRPRVIVDYEREPYVMVTGDVRITFDKDVRAVAFLGDLFDPALPALHVLEPGKLIMEVKFTELLPDIVKRILPPRSSELAAVSKYVLCCEKTAFLAAETTIL